MVIVTERTGDSGSPVDPGQRGNDGILAITDSIHIASRKLFPGGGEFGDYGKGLDPYLGIAIASQDVDARRAALEDCWNTTVALHDQLTEVCLVLPTLPRGDYSPDNPLIQETMRWDLEVLQLHINSVLLGLLDGTENIDASDDRRKYITVGNVIQRVTADVYKQMMLHKREDIAHLFTDEDRLRQLFSFLKYPWGTQNEEELWWDEHTRPVSYNIRELLFHALQSSHGTEVAQALQNMDESPPEGFLDHVSPQHFIRRVTDDIQRSIDSTRLEEEEGHEEKAMGFLRSLVSFSVLREQIPALPQRIVEGNYNLAKQALGWLRSGSVSPLELQCIHDVLRQQIERGDEEKIGQVVTSLMGHIEFVTGDRYRTWLASRPDAIDLADNVYSVVPVFYDVLKIRWIGGETVDPQWRRETGRDIVDTLLAAYSSLSSPLRHSSLPEQKDLIAKLQRKTKNALVLVLSHSSQFLIQRQIREWLVDYVAYWSLPVQPAVSLLGRLMESKRVPETTKTAIKKIMARKWYKRMTA